MKEKPRRGTGGAIIARTRILSPRGLAPDGTRQQKQSGIGNDGERGLAPADEQGISPWMLPGQPWHEAMSNLHRIAPQVREVQVTYFYE